MRAVGTAIITAALFLTDFVAAQSLSEKSALLSAPVMKDTSTLVGDNSAPSAISLRESGLIELTDMPVSGLSGETGDTKDYYMDIGAGISTLVVTLEVSTGDPDLYVGRTFPPSIDNADCESALPEGNDEECKINNPVEGRYYISVLAYSSYDGAVLKATFPSPPVAPTITGITPANGALEVAFEAGSGSADSYQLSCVDPSLRNAADVLPFITEPETALFSRSVMNDTSVKVDGQTFSSAKAFHESGLFRREGRRCGAMERNAARQHLLGSGAGAANRARGAADCTNTLTTISSEHIQPAGQVLRIPVYFHVIYKADGEGYISEARILDQMAVLNEDFAGGNGLSIQNTAIQFDLVYINYVQNDSYFEDAGEGGLSKYSLAIDPTRYMNVYTNDGNGYLGYATLPAGSAGGQGDGIVMLHETIGGRNNSYGYYNQGRTLVHEVGHYLGLFHTFDPEGDCTNTYTGGDLIVDTPPQLYADSGTQPSTGCGPRSAIENFMNYSIDDAMYTFTSEQTNRMTCSLVNYRSNAYSTSSTNTFTADGTTSPITVSGLVNGRPYNCSVTATNTAGTSAASPVVVGVPKPPSVPGTPLISRVDAGDGELNLSISVPDNGGLAISSYSASCSDGTDIYSASSATPSVTITGLTNATPYSCSVSVANSLGNSPASVTVSGAPDEAPITLPLWIFVEALRVSSPAPE
ncbi:M43 family zinc metalloprotease [Luminiphilus sp.]|nr:M43 family zinc metalloprotease [Luminiphilus sp.]